MALFWRQKKAHRSEPFSIAEPLPACEDIGMTKCNNPHPEGMRGLYRRRSLESKGECGGNNSRNPPTVLTLTTIAPIHTGNVSQIQEQIFEYLLSSRQQNEKNS